MSCKGSVTLTDRYFVAAVTMILTSAQTATKTNLFNTHFYINPSENLPLKLNINFVNFVLKAKSMNQMSRRLNIFVYICTKINIFMCNGMTSCVWDSS